MAKVPQPCYPQHHYQWPCQIACHCHYQTLWTCVLWVEQWTYCVGSPWAATSSPAKSEQCFCALGLLLGSLFSPSVGEAFGPRCGLWHGLLVVIPFFCWSRPASLAFLSSAA